MGTKKKTAKKAPKKTAAPKTARATRDVPRMPIGKLEKKDDGREHVTEFGRQFEQGAAKRVTDADLKGAREFVGELARLLPDGTPVFMRWPNGEPRRAVLVRYNDAGSPVCKVANVDDEGRYLGGFAKERVFDPDDILGPVTPIRSTPKPEQRVEQPAPSDVALLSAMAKPEPPKPEPPKPKPRKMTGAEALASASPPAGYVNDPGNPRHGQPIAVQHSAEKSKAALDATLETAARAIARGPSTEPLPPKSGETLNDREVIYGIDQKCPAHPTKFLLVTRNGDQKLCQVDGCDYYLTKFGHEAWVVGQGVSMSPSPATVKKSTFGDMRPPPVEEVKDVLASIDGFLPTLDDAEEKPPWED